MRIAVRCQFLDLIDTLFEHNTNSNSEIMTIIHAPFKKSEFHFNVSTYQEQKFMVRMQFKQYRKNLVASIRRKLCMLPSYASVV